jgi:hypothetical protein
MTTGIIDPDYRGQIFIMMKNTTKHPLEYTADGNAIAQLIFKPCIRPTLQEVSTLSTTLRQEGGFGSTNVGVISTHPGKMVFDTTINGTKVFTLIDSGADGIFCGQNCATLLKFKPSKLKKPITITMADGSDHSITQVANNVEYTIQGFKAKMNIYIMPVDHDHIILGNHWLANLNPQINWKEKTATIKKDGQVHVLKVNPTPGSDQVNFITNAKDYEPEEGDNFYLIDAEIDDDLGIVPEPQEDITDPDLAALLEEFQDIFRDELPDTKPTSRSVEHTITLKEGAQPVKAYQYRLSPLHQEAIQKSITELLRLGHIKPSKSAWQAPLLVIIKKDGTF